jgi:hypothetical protein
VLSVEKTEGDSGSSRATSVVDIIRSVRGAVLLVLLLPPVFTPFEPDFLRLVFFFLNEERPLFLLLFLGNSLLLAYTV